MKTCPPRNGFTLIEIVSVLVILGVLAAVAVPKYFDLQEESEKKAALSAVAEAQARIQLSFGQQILRGQSCEDAVKEVSDVNKLSDDGAGAFGEFILLCGTITTAGTDVSAKRGKAGVAFPTGAKLYLPSCDEDSLANVASKFWVSNVLEYLDQRKTQKHEDIPVETSLTLANGVKVSLGNNWYNADGTSTAEFVFQGNGQEKVEFKLQDMNDGTIQIWNMNVYTDSGSRKQLVHGSYVTTSQNDIQQATAALKNMGFDPKTFAQVLEVGRTSGTLIVEKSFFQ